MNLALSPAERAGLVAFAARRGLRPKDVLLRFVRDLTECPGNGGSNERDAAQNWADASLWPLSRPLPPAQEERSWALDARFHRLREHAEAEWLREYRARASASPTAQAAALASTVGTGNSPFVDSARECGRAHDNAECDRGEQSVAEGKSE